MNKVMAILAVCLLLVAASAEACPPQVFSFAQQSSCGHSYNFQQQSYSVPTYQAPTFFAYPLTLQLSIPSVTVRAEAVAPQAAPAPVPQAPVVPPPAPARIEVPAPQAAVEQLQVPQVVLQQQVPQYFAAPVVLQQAVNYCPPVVLRNVFSHSFDYGFNGFNRSINVNVQRNFAQRSVLVERQRNVIVNRSAPVRDRTRIVVRDGGRARLFGHFAGRDRTRIVVRSVSR